MSALTKAPPFIKQGWFLFPAFWDEGKHKGLVRWGKGSSNDMDIIAQWAERWPNCYFCVNLKASNLVVIDVDRKNGKDGTAVLKTLPDLPKTMVSTTPNGGFHYFFKGDCARGTNKLGLGVDVPHMVPLPGQTAGTKGEYKLVKTGTPAKLPEWVVSKAGEPKGERILKDSNTVTDEKASVNLAINYLKTSAPESHEGSGGDQVAFSVSCRVRDFGISEAKTLELLLCYWNPMKAYPPWTEEELSKKVANAFTYARDVIGNASIESMFPDSPEKTEDGRDIMRSAADTDIKDLKPREWILGYRYLPGYITLTIAPGGVGKSLLTILEGLSLASGKNLTYDTVKKKSAVWLYNTEDPFDELDRRVLATAAHHGLVKDEIKEFYYSSSYDSPLCLVAYDDKHRTTVNDKTVQWIIGRMLEKKIKLLIIDPFVECHSVDENDNMAINVVAQVLRCIAKETGAAISIVHHTNKGEKNVHGNADKSRGASSLASAARIMHTFFNMGEKESKDYAIPVKDAPWYTRLDPAKGNLSPPGGDPQWFVKKSFDVSWDSEETIGVLEKQEMFKREMTEEDERLMVDVFNMVDAGTSVSTFILGAKIEETGMMGVKQKAITRKIETIFGGVIPRLHEGYWYEVRVKDGQTKKGVNHVYCWADEGGE